MTVKIDIAGSEKVLTIALQGDLDISGVPTLEKELKRLEAQSPSHIVLDLRKLTFLDSSGLRAIVSADSRARRDGWELTVVQGPDTIRRVFSITLMDKRLKLVEEPPDGQGS